MQNKALAEVEWPQMVASHSLHNMGGRGRERERERESEEGRGWHAKDTLLAPDSDLGKGLVKP